MSIKTAYSTKHTAEEAAIEIKNMFAGIHPKMVVFFASSIFDQQSISQMMKETFSNAQVFGCSTAGEIVSGKVLKNAIVAMAFDEETISDVKVEIAQNIKAGTDIKGIFNNFGQYYSIPANKMSPDEYVGMILIDGLSLAEEKIMDMVGDLTNVVFVGGSAGDDLKFSATHVCANGQAYTNAAVLALIKPAVGFDFIKTQSFRTLDKRLMATKVNESSREIIEFNNQPAAKTYAEALNTTPDDLSNRFIHNPVGLLIGNDIYVRSPQQTKGDNVVFYCVIKQGVELALLESTNIVKDTRASVEEKRNGNGNISGIINFHCILRTLDLEQQGLTEEYGKIFSDIPTIGFSTYGEEYLGHINQTSTMQVFK
jgi:hypothetical protein